MFKRVIWMSVGAAAGSVATVWAERKVKTRIETISQMATPQRVAEATRTRIVDVRDTVVAAVSEGRNTKQDTESQMRRAVDERWGRDRPSA
jgi:hypothetical protein